MYIKFDAQVSFNAASTFLYKISGGNIGVWRSKAHHN